MQQPFEYGVEFRAVHTAAKRTTASANESDVQVKCQDAVKRTSIKFIHSQRKPGLGVPYAILKPPSHPNTAHIHQLSGYCKIFKVNAMLYVYS